MPNSTSRPVAATLAARCTRFDEARLVLDRRGRTASRPGCASGSSRSSGEGGDRDGRRRVARDRLQDDGARRDAGALELLLDQEAVIVVAEEDRRARSRPRGFRRFSVAPRKLALWPLKKRMNCLGYMARDSGHSRVPEPPDRMTGNTCAHCDCAPQESAGERAARPSSATAPTAL